MTASAWTDERIERLKTLWREGQTAEQIALALANGITRSAVLGKVYRLGLSAGRPERRSARKRARPRGKPVSRPSASPQRRAVDAPVPAQAPAPACADLPSGGVSLLAIGCRQCRWPYGDPRTGISFCGRPVARGAYCEGHGAVGYRSPPGGAAALMALAGLA